MGDVILTRKGGRREAGDSHDMGAERHLGKEKASARGNRKGLAGRTIGTGFSDRCVKTLFCDLLLCMLTLILTIKTVAALLIMGVSDTCHGSQRSWRMRSAVNRR